MGYRDIPPAVQALRKSDQAKRLHPGWMCRFCVCGARIHRDARQCQDCALAEVERYNYEGSGGRIPTGHCGCTQPYVDSYGHDPRPHDSEGRLIVASNCRYRSEWRARVGILRDEDDWQVDEWRRGYERDD